jgi:hypothetical protein
VEALDPLLGYSSHRNRIWVTLDQTFEEDGAYDINDLEGPLNRDTTRPTTDVGETKTAPSHSIYVLEWQGIGKVDFQCYFATCRCCTNCSFISLSVFTDERGDG